MIKIKPHHFMDIIKLYGSGIDVFVPDLNFNHDFYLIANKILKDKNLKLELTIGEDSICKPCKYMKNGLCQDSISHIENVNSKDAWNKILDKRLLSYLNMNIGDKITALDFCNKLYSIKDYISSVWKEDNPEVTLKRYNFFCLGACKYLNL